MATILVASNVVTQVSPMDELLDLVLQVVTLLSVMSVVVAIKSVVLGVISELAWGFH